MIEFPFFNMQQLNLDWIIDKIKGMLSFLPDDGTAGQILRRTADGAEWSDEETGGGAVDSVNGQTGTVVLGADDILMNDNTSVEDSLDDLKSATCYEGSGESVIDVTPEFTTGMIGLNGSSIGGTVYSHTNRISVFPGDVIRFYNNGTFTAFRSAVAYVNGVADSSLGGGGGSGYLNSYIVPDTVTEVVLNCWTDDIGGIIKITRTVVSLKMKIDTTLTTEGYAADAKSVGDKLLPLVGITANEGDTF